MNREQREVKGIVFNEQEIRDMQRACKLGIVATAQQDLIDYDYVMRLADLYRRLENFIWIMERDV